MDRKEFLKQLGVGVTLIASGSLIDACKKEDPALPILISLLT